MRGEKETVSVEPIVEPEPPRQASLSPPVQACRKISLQIWSRSERLQAVPPSISMKYWGRDGTVAGETCRGVFSAAG